MKWNSLSRKIGPAGAPSRWNCAANKEDWPGWPRAPARLFLFAYFPISWLDETLISSRFLLWRGFLFLLFWRFVWRRQRLFYHPPHSLIPLCASVCFTGVVYGSLISTQNNATGAKVFSENEQFNHMAGHKKRHEANRQHPSNLLGKFSTCEPNLTPTTRDDGVRNEDSGRRS